MSEPIQAIANNNYILHNIDAKKLYVQEPLFTANSGDAVYVGWKPDETVLYDGNLTGNGATAQLSEPIQNFERIKVYGHTDDGLNSTWFTEFYPDENNTMDVGAAANNAGWGKWFSFTITTEGLYTNVTGKVMTFDSNVWGNLTNWGTTRVIGINRKENA